MKKQYTISIFAVVIFVLFGFGIKYISINRDIQLASAAQLALIPTFCVDSTDGEPVITSISATSGSVGTKIRIGGCNLSGFEGDNNAWIENNKGEIGILRGEDGSTSHEIWITPKMSLCKTDESYTGEDCGAWLTLIPGSYKIYVAPWGKVSNKIVFTIDQSKKISTPITYNIQQKGKTNLSYCDGANMDSIAYKESLTQKISTSTFGNLSISEIIKHTLLTAANENLFNSTYTKINEISYSNHALFMGSPDGWAGSSIFYCAWKPFVEKNLEQFTDVKEIIWDSLPAQKISQT